MADIKMNYDRGLSSRRKPITKKDSLEDVMESRRSRDRGNEEEIIDVLPKEEIISLPAVNEEELFGKMKEEKENVFKKEQKKAPYYKPPYANVAKGPEIMIKKYETMETHITDMKGQINSFRDLLDDLAFKLESAVSIIGVLKSNEARKVTTASRGEQQRSNSSSNVNDLLELLKNPAVQNLVRTFTNNGNNNRNRNNEEKNNEDVNENKEES